MNKTIKKISFSLSAIVILFIILEIILRLSISITSERVSNNPDLKHNYKLWQMHLFNSFLGIHEPDQQLFWKLKANYQSRLLRTNSDGFIGNEIEEKDENEFRILFLGDSTPLGIGLDSLSKSFVFQLEKLLQERVSDKKIKVINSSTAGYSSFQCRRLLEIKGRKLVPDLVICYFGNNDPSINGYLTDKELAELTGDYSQIKSFLNKSFSYQLLKTAILSTREKLQSNKTLKVRVPLEDFQDNLKAINKWCLDNNSLLAVCTIPTPYFWPPGIQFKVFAGGKDQQGRLVMAEEMREDINSKWSLCLDTMLLPGLNDIWTQRVYATAFQEKGDLRDQIQFYQTQLQKNPDNPHYLNNLGTALWFFGQDSEQLFNQALSLDSLNPIILYNYGISIYRTNWRKAKIMLERGITATNFH